MGFIVNMGKPNSKPRIMTLKNLTFYIKLQRCVTLQKTKI